jgi:hypothetical protein
MGGDLRTLAWERFFSPVYQLGDQSINSSYNPVPPILKHLPRNHGLVGNFDLLGTMGMFKIRGTGLITINTS